MNLSLHKITIALTLSGLLHGLFLFGGFDNSLLIQTPGPQLNSLYLELVAREEVASSQPREAARETNRESLIAQAKVAARHNLNRAEKKTEPEKYTHDEPSSNTAMDHYNQRKQLSRPVENHDVLTQLVYQAISEHKRYPYMARRMGQQGKVTLNFVMHPDGQVTDVMVIESSRYSVLDRAAEQAVVAISPFAMAADYLVFEKVFDIAVDFRLN